MPAMKELFALVADLVPLLGTAAGVFLALYGMYWLLLGRRRDLGNERRLPRQLIMLMAMIAGTVAIALALPVSDSTRNQVISLIGLLLSGVIAFSSTTIVSNLMAGLMLHMTKAFRTGDFIRVGDHFGRVAERGLFDTEIQTEQRELVSLANTYLITHPLTVVRSSGTIISANLSLGYDLHHSRIRNLLVAAALDSGLEEPFVQVIELGDYSITYRISGLLTNIKSMITARSNLHKSILDTLHADGVEIVSPSFMNQRRLAQNELIVPTPTVEVRSGDESNPEDILFDKAEQAEQQERARFDLVEEIRKLEAQVKAADGEEKQRLSELAGEKRDQLAELGRPVGEDSADADADAADAAAAITSATRGA